MKASHEKSDLGVNRAKKRRGGKTVSSLYVGVDLSFQSVTRQVLSAQVSLTAVFGMGTGGPSPLKTPTVNGYCQILNQYDCVVKQNLRPENRTKGEEEGAGILHNVGQALG